MLFRYITFCFFLFFLISCDNDDDFQANNNEVETPTDTLDTPIVSICDSTLRPIIMLHGFLASGDTYELQFQRFESNNYCSENLYVFDWNSLDQTGDTNSSLDFFIDEVRNSTGFDKVDLAGHSAGSGACYAYLSDSLQSNKIAHYVHLAGNPESDAAGYNANVPTLNIWSPADLVVPGGTIANAENLVLENADHYEVATSEATFEAMFSFFNEGLAPETTEILEENQIFVSGKVLSFGENIPNEGATVNIYELNSETGYRVSEIPNFSVITNENGKYERVEVEKNIHYEFEVITNIEGDRKVHYYRETFKRSDQLVYLRTLPSAGLASLLLGGLPIDDNQSVLAFYSGSKAVITDRDVLTVNETVLSTPDFCSASNTTIAMFFYDGNSNEVSDVTDIGGTWSLIPVFLAAVDLFFPTEIEESIEVNLNDRKLIVPNLKSGSDGVIITQFN